MNIALLTESELEINCRQLKPGETERDAVGEVDKVVQQCVDPLNVILKPFGLRIRNAGTYIEGDMVVGGFDFDREDMDIEPLRLQLERLSFNFG